MADTEAEPDSPGRPNVSSTGSDVHKPCSFMSRSQRCPGVQIADEPTDAFQECLRVCANT